MGTMGAILLVFISPFIVWPLGSLIAKIRKRETEPKSGSRLARGIALIVSGLNLVFLLTLFFSLGDPTLGLPFILQVALVIPLISILLTVILTWRLLVSWFKGYWSFLGRLYYTLIWLASVLFIVFAGYWNMLGWKF